MEMRQLGNSDLVLSTIGIGAWAMGGADWAFGWSDQDDRESIRAIHAALDAGINWIDTAAVYGLGHSEEVVARAIDEYTGKRPYLFTKCERTWDANRQIQKCLKRESIIAECEASLLRLRTDVIDLYQIHWPEPEEDIEEGWQTLADLQKQGKVRWIGVSNFSVAQMERIGAIAPVTSLQPPYSLIRPEVEAEVLPYAMSSKIGVIAYSPMGSGMLSGTMTRQRVSQLPKNDWRTRSPFFNEPLLSKNLEIADRINRVSKETGIHPGQLAIRYVIENPAVTGAIVGFRNAAQVSELVGAMSIQLNAEVKHYLRAG